MKLQGKKNRRIHLCSGSVKVFGSFGFFSATFKACLMGIFACVGLIILFAIYRLRLILLYYMHMNKELGSH